MASNTSNPFRIGAGRELLERYGAILERSVGKLDPRRVPRELHLLIPYAQVFGVSDDLVREQLVEDSPREILGQLQESVASLDDELDDWLAGPEAENPEPTAEYIAFSAMRMAADFA